MSQRVPVTFVNRHGLTLFGVLHKPDGPSDLAVLLLSPGVKMRVGPQRLYTRMTDLFVSLGITVFRFDFYGLGDSEGTLTEGLLKDVYNHIEVGRFVDDTIDAMHWLQQHHGIARVITSGLCGGAITGLFAGQQDSRVVGLLALGITPVLASRAAAPGTYMTTGELKVMREWYLTKLMSPKAWLRLLTFQSDYRVMWKAITLPWRDKIAARAARAAGPGPATVDRATTATAESGPAPSGATVSDVAVIESDNANPLFPPAFFRMLETSRPMLLVFGGSDRLHYEFDEKFLARHQARLAGLPAAYHVHVVKDANHTLSFTHWQDEMLALSKQWLCEHFPHDVRLSA